MSSVTVAIDHGERVMCSTDLVMKGSAPTMSRWTAARMRDAISGYVDRYAIVPVISDGQMKRIVRTGGGIRFESMSVFSVRAISRFAAQPLALSFAPGFS